MRFKIIRNQWEHFLVSIGMDPRDDSRNNYFDQMKAKDVEDIKFYWLCLGNVSRTGEIRNAVDVSNERKNNNCGRQNN